MKFFRTAVIRARDVPHVKVLVLQATSSQLQDDSNEASRCRYVISVLREDYSKCCDISYAKVNGVQTIRRALISHLNYQ